jgi:hypothetical protein
MKRALLAGCLVVAWTLMGSVARAADREAIDKAVERGTAFLRQHGAASQDFNTTGQPVGASALVGLTLLECGAGPDDEAVRGIAAMVRPASVDMHQTYSLALSILFLDRLGDPSDVPLIQSMTVRLLAGQNASGGWSYECPAVGEAEVRRLTAHLKEQAELIGRRERPKVVKGDNEPDAKPARPSVKDLPKEIQQQLDLIRPTAPGSTQIMGDNSNTQFATMALWVGRRQGLPVEKALARIDQRFRVTQNPDGGWTYSPVLGGAGVSTATMTCAGLLGLAVAHGSVAEVALEKGKTVPDPSKDRAVKAALALLGTAVGHPFGKGRAGAPPLNVPMVGGRTYYFFWSLERVAVALDLKTIGGKGKDWYAWGADVLLANQAPDGSWQGEYSAPVDTCFALLFLKRANLASDLTARLKGKLQDPGEVTLKAGGSADDLLKGPPGFTSGLEMKDGKYPVVSRPPPSAADTEGALMARELFQAPAERRGPLLEKYRDGKGVTYTEALAGAIPHMDGEAKSQARDALAERLTRMKTDTLVRYFQDQDAEIRRAAALAAAMKEDKALIPDLIPLLDDAEPTVAHAALAALKDVSGEKLGPSAEEWKAWWKRREGK